MKTILTKLKNIWNAPKPTEEEIKVNSMMNILFTEQTTEQVIDTLILFNEQARKKLADLNLQAKIDSAVCEHYFSNNIVKKQELTILN